MSVAAALARLRETGVAAQPPSKNIPSLLDDLDVHRIPRAELAALAKNSLHMLAAVDATLITFAEPLLISTPQLDRTTLPPNQLSALSEALVLTALRISPVFTLRAATKIFEWFIQALNVSRLGTHEEVSAIFISALPFHATQNFVRLTRAILGDKRHSSWDWLKPVARQSKPPSIDFLHHNCPDAVLHLLLKAASKTVMLGVTNTAQTSLIANLLVRRLSTKPNRQLALSVLETCTVLKELKHDDKVPLIVELLSALLVAMAAALPKASQEIASAMLQSASAIFLNAPKETPFSDLALTTVALAVTHSVDIPAHVAVALFRGSKFRLALPRLQNLATARSVFLATLLRFVRSLLDDMSPFSSLNEALVDHEICPDDSVTQVIVALLDLFPQFKTAEAKEFTSLVSETISSLAHGRYADAVDTGLRQHFDNRLQNVDKKHYKYADKAITRGLRNAPIQTVKLKSDAKEGNLSAYDGTLIGALDHPEPSVRLLGLNKVIEECQNSWRNIGTKSEAYPSKLLHIISDDVDIKCVAKAVQCLEVFLSRMEHAEVLSIVAQRYISEAKALSSKKSIDTMGMQDFAQNLIALCLQLHSKDDLRVESLLIGLIISDILPVDQVSDSQSALKQMIPSCAASIEKNEDSLSERIKKDVSSRVENSFKTLKTLMNDLMKWDIRWIIIMVKSWLGHLAELKLRSSHSTTIHSLVKYLASTFENFEAIRADICEALMDRLPLLHNSQIPEPMFRSICDQIWMLVSRVEKHVKFQKYVGQLFEEIGLLDTIAMMKRGCSHLGSDGSGEIRRVSLKWFVNISAAHSSKAVQDEAMFVLLHALYADDPLSRKEAERLCTSCSLEGLNGKSSSLSVLGEVASEVLERGVLSLEELSSDEISQELIRSVLPWCADSSGTTLPLTMCLQAKTRLEFKQLLDMICDRIVNPNVSDSERLLLLRAIEGTKLGNQEQHNRLLTLLQKYLDAMVPDDFSSKKSNEYIARMTALISPEKLSHVDGKTVTSRVKSIVAKLSTSRAPSVNADLPPQADVTFVCLFARMFSVLSSSKETKNIRNDILSHVLSSSSKSSIGGESAQKLLGVVFDPVVPLKHIGKFLTDIPNLLATQPKKRRTTEEQTPFIDGGFKAKVAIGALRNVQRRVAMIKDSSSKPTTSLYSLKVPLWKFIMSVMELSEDEKSEMEEDLVFEFGNVIDVLALLHSVDSRQDSENDLINISVVADTVFFPYPGFQGEENALLAAVRGSALELMEVLAPQFGDQLKSVILPVIEHIFDFRDSERALRSLQRIIGALVASNCEFDIVAKWICSTAYGKAHWKPLSADKRAIIAACSRMNTANSASGVVMCLQEIWLLSTASVSEQLAAQECSEFLLEVNQSAAADLRAIYGTDEKLTCTLSAAHILHPAFVTKLLEALAASEDRDSTAIEVALSSLFKKLLSCSALSTRKDALGAVLAILPLQSLAKCVTEALATEEQLLRERTLEALTHRLDARYKQWAYAWSFDINLATYGRKAEKKIEKDFVEQVGAALCDLAERDPTQISIDIRQAAVSNLENLSRTFGASSRDQVLEFCSTLMGIINSPKTKQSYSPKTYDEEHLVFLTSVLLCLSSMMLVLAKRAAPFIPRLMEFSATVLEVTFKNPQEDVPERITSALVGLSEAAVRACTCTLETVPRMFGRKTLQKIASIAVVVNVDVLEDLLEFAIQKVPSHSSVVALTVALDELQICRESYAGVLLVMRCTQKAVEKIRKKELKDELENFLDIFWKCLDFRRKCYEGSISPNEEASNEEDDEDSVVHETDLAVDNACTDAFLAMVLKLSESDFKVLYNKFIQWSDGATLSEEASLACSTVEIEVAKNILRAIPLYKVTAALLNTLKGLMIPYFAHLVDNVLSVISMKRPIMMKPKTAEKAKKRKRPAAEEDRATKFGGQLCKLQAELGDLCLDNLTLFLRQSLNETVLKKNVVVKIQDGLISAFDEVDVDYSRVMDGLQALAQRILTMGSAEESKEESRELLMSLSRTILARSRDLKASVRKASLDCAKCLAKTVGDEFLVTLPETMPVLADVIDDEDDAVQEAGKSFAQVMEALAGEPILEQLK